MRDAGQRLDHRRLPRAALADDRDELPGLHLDRGAIEDALALDVDCELLGGQAERAAIVAGNERGAVEDQPERTDADFRPDLDGRALDDELAVEAGAVARAEVAQLVCAVDGDDLGVEAR